MNDYNVTHEYNHDVHCAIEDAERFLAKARAYLESPGFRYNSSSRAAMKRASMDLSRSLVAVRGPAR